MNYRVLWIIFSRRRKLSRRHQYSLVSWEILGQLIETFCWIQERVFNWEVDFYKVSHLSVNSKCISVNSPSIFCTKIVALSRSIKELPP